MMEPQSLLDMIQETRIEPVTAAAVRTFADLMPDVTVTGHPGKLDIADVVKRSVVRAPGVAVGWSSIKRDRQIVGTYLLSVSFAAYVVVEDYVDRAAKRRIARDVVAHAIGGRLLNILSDSDLAAWGLEGVTLPLLDPEPEFKPLFTAKDAEAGTAYYAVTWRQSIVDLGAAIMDGPTPATDEALPGVRFEEDFDLPPEVRAMISEGDDA
ncbi:hypothetical protein [Amorphus sp. MBR-141]